MFTAEIRPSREEGWEATVAGFAGPLREAGLPAAEAVALTLAALSGRELTKRELGGALQPLMPEPLRPWFEPQTFSEFTAILAAGEEGATGSSWPWRPSAG